MRMKQGLAVAMVVVCASAAFVAPVVAHAPALSMLDMLERGSWEMRYRNGDQPAERICLDSGRRFIQLKHPNVNCRRVIVDDNETQVTVQYTCPGRGYGRTSIRRETSRLVQIDSQGIVEGLPFSFAAEARRVGNCSN